MEANSVAGKDNSTLVERSIGRLPLPYWVSCIVIAVLMGPPVQFLSALVDTSSLDKAFSLTFNSGFSTTFSVAVSPAQGIEAQTIWTVTLLVVLYIPRFMRLRLQTYAADLVPISPSGAGTLRKAFGGIYQLRPAVVVSGVIGALSLPYIYFQTNLITGAATLLYLTISNVIVSLVFGTIIWVYFRSLWGLYKFGKEPLKLMTHDEDPMLGVRPIGSISLSLFLSYILVIGFGGLELVLSPDPVSLSLLLVLALLGGFMFFLPLNSMHKKMLAEKRGGRKNWIRHFRLSRGVRRTAETRRPKIFCGAFAMFRFCRCREKFFRACRRGRSTRASWEDSLP